MLCFVTFIVTEEPLKSLFAAVDSGMDVRIDRKIDRVIERRIDIRIMIRIMIIIDRSPDFDRSIDVFLLAKAVGGTVLNWVTPSSTVVYLSPKYCPGSTMDWYSRLQAGEAHHR